MKTFRISILIFLAAGALLYLFLEEGSTRDSSYVRDGKEYGVVQGAFRNRWWNYYERAQSFAEGEFYDEALADLKQAIRQREEDQRMARTYGMHFVDYFPHRELGIVYFSMGRYKEAEEELEKSLSQVDTGRAKYYLNEARKALLESSSEDTAPPAINITSTSEPEATNSFKLTLEGEVEDDTYASKIAINDEPLFVELSSKTLPFSREIKLKKGINEIKIKSTDLLGKETEKKVKVIGDFEGPALNIDNYSDGQETGEKSILLKGAMADATGIVSLKVNDTVLAYDKEKEVEFAVNLDLKDGDTRISLAATDIAGNTTTNELTLTYVPKLAKKGSKYAKAVSARPDLREPIRLALNGSGILDTGQGLFYASSSSNETEAAFRLNIKDLTDTQKVYFDTIYIDGSASGSNKITSVKINSSPLLIVPGKTIYFNQLIELKPGENKITLEVTDEKGRSLTRAINIIRDVPKVHQIGSRMSIAVLPFERTGEASSTGDIVYDNLINAFVEQNRFNIVTRGDELNAVLRELKLSQTDLVDQSNAVKVGKLVAAEGILMGTIRETKDSIEIYARLVNTETSIILEARDVYGQDKSLSQVQYLTNGLALKLKNSFPLIEGIVVKTTGNNVYVDFGSIQGIKKQMKFIVFREGKPITHPVTGKILGSETEELGVATVVDVYEDMSMGKLLADFDASRIKIKDLIITK
jgi:tetratricopeptide (TPR) repeat protein